MLGLHTDEVFEEVILIHLAVVVDEYLDNCAWVVEDSLEEPQTGDSNGERAVRAFQNLHENVFDKDRDLSLEVLTEVLHKTRNYVKTDRVDGSFRAKRVLK